MRVLLLSVTAGQGHNSCAKAVISALEEQNIKCQMLDTIKYIDKVTGSIVDKGYSNLTAKGKFAPQIWGKLYINALKSSIRSNAMESLISAGLSLKSAKFEEYVCACNPDAIVTTHFLAAIMAGQMRKKNLIDVPIIGINTDYTLHPFWQDVEQDFLVVANKKMAYELDKRGIPQKQILPIGVPVNIKFKDKMTPEQGREKLGIAQKTTITIMGASTGFGSLFQDVLDVSNLEIDFQIIVVCANNTHAKKELEEAKAEGKIKKDIYIYGFTDKIFEIMSASEIVCTKPGGLSTSECMSVGRPMILLEPIPGLEEINATFLVNCGAAVRIDKFYSLAMAVSNLLLTPQRMEQIVQIQKTLSPENAATYLAQIVQKLIIQKIETPI